MTQYDPFEEMLRQMPLKAPPASLDTRMAARLSRSARLWRRLAIATAGLAAAAALVLIAVLSRMNAPVAAPHHDPLVLASASTPAPAIAAGLVQMEHDISTIQYDGIRMVDDQPLRQFRQRTFHVIETVDESNNVKRQVQMPSERVYLVRAQTY